MKNKGFTLVEVLAVIVILGIIATMATIAITRQRGLADDKDLLNLHSSMSTAFTNYRTVLAQTGKEARSYIVNPEEKDDFDKYIDGLSYNGKRLTKQDLSGTTITIYNKGSILRNPDYIEAVKNRIENYNSLTPTQKELAEEKEYISDATCLVESTVCKDNDPNPPSVCTDGHPFESQYEGAHIAKACKGQYSNFEISKDELVCLSIWYQGTNIINDKGETNRAKVFNELCKYAREV